MPLTTADFDYELDPDRIAQTPLPRRDDSRLLRLCRPDGRCSHHHFRDLPQLLRPGDLLVLNDTRVIPAKFEARRATGRRIEGLFLAEPAVGTWEALLRNAGGCRIAERLDLAGAPGTRLELRQHLGQGRWLLGVAPPAAAAEILERAGAAPLPPYIRRWQGRGDEAVADDADRPRYQTVYAEKPGAVAAPTAGLHFTDELLARLAAAGIEAVRVTLHVGLGTFLPVKTEDPADHEMHRERYEIGPQAAERLNGARAAGQRIVAVGTTVVRVLEAEAARGGPFRPTAGETDIFLYPPADFRAADALITNFHLPRSTLLMLVAAFCRPGGAEGIKTILDVYRLALAEGYRFYSYGDAMLIE